MKLTSLLWGAAAAAVLLTAAFVVVSVVNDPVVQDCASASAAVAAANTAHQDALEVLDSEERRRAVNEAVVQRARTAVDHTKHALIVARADYARRCHLQEGDTR